MSTFDKYKQNLKATIVQHLKEIEKINKEEE